MEGGKGPRPVAWTCRLGPDIGCGEAKSTGAAAPDVACLHSWSSDGARRCFGACPDGLSFVSKGPRRQADAFFIMCPLGLLRLLSDLWILWLHCRQKSGVPKVGSPNLSTNWSSCWRSCWASTAGRRRPGQLAPALPAATRPCWRLGQGCRQTLRTLRPASPRHCCSRA